MATITFARTTDNVNGAQMGMSASINFPDIIATGSTFSIPTVTGTMTSSTYRSSTYVQTEYQNSAWFRTNIYANGKLLKKGLRFESGYLYIGSSSGWATKNWTTTGTEIETTGSNLTTSLFFNSSNPTARSVPITLGGSWSITSDWGSFSNSSGTVTGSANLILDVPPTATVSSISYDTNFVYAGLTTASVTVSNATAYYGGDISSVTLTIGSQSASISGNGTVSLALAVAGTFTPTVTVKDSRGQIYTESLSPITVNAYVPPTVSFTAERTASTGVPDDEGTYATCPSTFIFADAIADLIAPSVVLTDENGTQTTPIVTWYTTRAVDGTLSGVINDWSSVSSGDLVYGLIPNLNTQYSYQISIRPRDNQGTGTAITQTVSSAFYTVDFLAGGHGIAFGQPASTIGFVCNMTADFLQGVDVTGNLTVSNDTTTLNVYLDMPDYQTASTTDKALYDAIVALGWDSDVLS